MRSVNLHAATTILSRFVDQAAREEPSLMAKTGTLLVKVVPVDPRALHGTPFDRIPIAQARIGGATLPTADAAMVRYGAPVELTL